MDIPDSLVRSIEEACLQAWDSLFGVVGAKLVHGVPPTDPCLVYHYCVEVARLLHEEHIRTRVVQGRYSNQCQHTWLVHTLNGEDVVIDLAVPDDRRAYCVFSEASRRQQMCTPQRDKYYQRIAIMSSLQSAARYNECMPEHGMKSLDAPLIPVCNGKFARCFLEIALHANTPSGNHDGVDVDYLKLCDLISSATNVQEVLPEIYPWISASCIITLIRACLGIARCQSSDGMHTNVADADALWKFLFGLKKTWKKVSSELRTMCTVSNAKNYDIDSVCSAYYQVIHAIVHIGNTTDAALTTEDPLATHRIDALSPATGHVASFLCYSTYRRERMEMDDITDKLRLMYHPMFIVLLEDVSRILYNTRVKSKTVAAKDVNAVKAVEMALVAAFPPEMHEGIRALTFHFFACMDTERSFIRHLLQSLSAWKKLEDTHELYRKEYVAQMAGGLPATEEHVDAPPGNPLGTTVMSSGYDHSRNAYRITLVPVAGEEVDETDWSSATHFVDYRGGGWTVQTDITQERVPGQLGRIGVLLNLLCIDHARQDVSRLRLVPFDANGTDVSHVLIPMLRALALPVTPLDEWDRYMSDIHLATTLLEYKVPSALVMCPSSFPVEGIDESKHCVDQWVMYFSKMPARVIRLLDVIKQRHAVTFKLTEGQFAACTVMTQTAPPCKLIGPKDTLVPGFYDSAIETLVADWLFETSSALSALIVVQEDIFSAPFKKALTRRKVPVMAHDISDRCPKLLRLVATVLHRGMVFASIHKGKTELFFHRDTSYFFETEYIAATQKLETGILYGKLSEFDAIPTITMSGGYLTSENTSVHIEPVTLTLHTWKDSECEFLQPWVRDHLRHAVMTSRMGVRISNAGIDLLPTVPRVCVQRNVAFTITAQVRNPLERIDRSFSCTSPPTYDAESGLYRVALGTDVQRWIETYAVAYQGITRTHIMAAPYTTAKITIYMCGTGFAAKPVASFSVNSPVKNQPYGDLTVCYKFPPKHTAALEMYEKRVAENLSVLYSIKGPSAIEGICREDALTGCKAMIAGKFFGCQNGKLMHDNLMTNITEEEFERFVAEEYYSFPFLHPTVKDASFTIGVKKFASIVYGESTPFVDSMQ